MMSCIEIFSDEYDQFSFSSQSGPASKKVYIQDLLFYQYTYQELNIGIGWVETINFWLYVQQNQRLQWIESMINKAMTTAPTW